MKKTVDDLTDEKFYHKVNLLERCIKAVIENKPITTNEPPTWFYLMKSGDSCKEPQYRSQIKKLYQDKVLDKYTNVMDTSSGGKWMPFVQCEIAKECEIDMDESVAKVECANCTWWYLDTKREQKGPCTKKQMDRLFLDKQITPTTMVWDGINVKAWTAIKDCGVSFSRGPPAPPSHHRQDPTVSDIAIEKIFDLFNIKSYEWGVVNKALGFTGMVTKPQIIKNVVKSKMTEAQIKAALSTKFTLKRRRLLSAEAVLGRLLM